MPIELTQKQLRILQFLASAENWVTRKAMEPSAGLKGFSKALGAPTHGLHSESLEALGLVERLDDSVPFQYRISKVGRVELRRLGLLAADPVKGALTEDEFHQDYERRLRESLEISALERQRRLQAAPTQPAIARVSSNVFIRNTDVVVEVLECASGQCGQCKNPAPFRKRRDGKPYLEVHHRKPLSEGGEDTVANAVALCPNCHRAAHYA